MTKTNVFQSRLALFLPKCLLPDLDVTHVHVPIVKILSKGMCTFADEEPEAALLRIHWPNVIWSVNFHVAIKGPLWRSEPESLSFKQHRMKTVARLALIKKLQNVCIYLHSFNGGCLIFIHICFYMLKFKWTFVHFEGKVWDFFLSFKLFFFFLI